MSVIVGWDAINKKLNDRPRKNDLFLRLKPDEDVVVVFLGEPCMTEVLWEDGGYQLFDPNKHADKKPTQRFSINVYLEKENHVSIFEGPFGFFEELKRARSKNSFESSVFRLKRVGEGQKTSYQIDCVMVLTDVVRQRIESLPRHDLEERASQSGKPKSSDVFARGGQARHNSFETDLSFGDNMPF